MSAAWHIPATEDTASDELGAEWFDRRNDPARRARRKPAELRGPGCDLALDPDRTVAVAVPTA